MAGSVSGALRCHTSLPSQVSSWKLSEPFCFCSSVTGFGLGLGGGAGGETLVIFFGLGRVGGGCFLFTSSAGMGSISGMEGSGGVWV